MDPTVTFKKIRNLITQAKNEEAAEQLLTYLTDAPAPANSWRDTVSNLLAQYKRVRLEQQRAVIDFDDARRAINQITDGLLAVLAGLENGVPAPVDEQDTTTASKQNTPWLAIGVVIALVLAGASFLMLRNMFKGEPTPPPDKVTVIEGETPKGKCPEYDEDSQFNVMILPFLPLDGIVKSVVTPLRIRLANKMEEYGVAGNVFSRDIDFKSSEYPFTSSQAAALGKPCNAQLIIWGTTEENGTDGGLITTTKFRFINSEHFSLTGLELTSNAEVDTVSSLSSIATSAELTENIEKTLMLIFALTLYETENHDAAAALLDTVIAERGGVAENPNWGLIQADSYIKAGQDQKAIEVYREMLKRDSTNVQALIQKGLLEYRSGQTSDANEDFNLALREDPNNSKALAARAAVSVKRNDLYQADKDLQQLESMEDRPKAAAQIRENYQVRRTEEERKMETADKQLRQNPNDTSAWRIKAETAQNLGQFQNAETAASNLLKIDPKNIPALRTLQAVMSKVPDSTQVRLRLERTYPQLSPQQIRQIRGQLKPGG